MSTPTFAFDEATGCTLKHEVFQFGDHALNIRSLRDKQEFHDPDGEAERLGISSAMWPIAGVIWPSGHALAELLVTLPIDGLRILEVGCGIGLASLVAQSRDADINATDRHPLVGPLLRRNAEANGLDAIGYTRCDWTDPVGTRHGYDLIVCSDLLYERTHAADLSRFLDHHAQPDATILMLAPQRGRRGQFARAMGARGFSTSRERAAPTVFEGQAYAGMLLTMARPTT